MEPPQQSETNYAVEAGRLNISIFRQRVAAKAALANGKQQRLQAVVDQLDAEIGSGELSEVVKAQKTLRVERKRGYLKRVKDKNLKAKARAQEDLMFAVILKNFNAVQAFGENPDAHLGPVGKAEFRKSCEKYADRLLRAQAETSKEGKESGGVTDSEKEVEARRQNNIPSNHSNSQSKEALAPQSESRGKKKRKRNVSSNDLDDEDEEALALEAEPRPNTKRLRQSDIPSDDIPSDDIPSDEIRSDELENGGTNNTKGKGKQRQQQTSSSTQADDQSRASSNRLTTPAASSSRRKASAASRASATTARHAQAARPTNMRGNVSSDAFDSTAKGKQPVYRQTTLGQVDMSGSYHDSRSANGPAYPGQYGQGYPGQQSLWQARPLAPHHPINVGYGTAQYHQSSDLYKGWQAPMLPEMLPQGYPPTTINSSAYDDYEDPLYTGRPMQDQPNMFARNYDHSLASDPNHLSRYDHSNNGQLGPTPANRLPQYEHLDHGTIEAQLNQYRSHSGRPLETQASTIGQGYPSGVAVDSAQSHLFDQSHGDLSAPTTVNTGGREYSSGLASSTAQLHSFDPTRVNPSAPTVEENHLFDADDDDADNPTADGQLEDMPEEDWFVVPQGDLAEAQALPSQLEPSAAPPYVSTHNPVDNASMADHSHAYHDGQGEMHSNAGNASNVGSDVFSQYINGL